MTPVPLAVSPLVSILVILFFSGFSLSFLRTQAVPARGESGLPALCPACEAEEGCHFTGIDFLLCGSCEIGICRAPDAFSPRFAVLGKVLPTLL